MSKRSNIHQFDLIQFTVVFFMWNQTKTMILGLVRIS